MAPQGGFPSSGVRPPPAPPPGQTTLPEAFTRLKNRLTLFYGVPGGRVSLFSRGKIFLIQNFGKQKNRGVLTNRSSEILGKIPVPPIRLTRGGRSPVPGFCLPGPKIYQARRRQGRDVAGHYGTNGKGGRHRAVT
jgi:hypothetical protein